MSTRLLLHIWRIGLLVALPFSSSLPAQEFRNVHKDVEEAFEAGNPDGACNLLRAFIAQNTDADAEGQAFRDLATVMNMLRDTAGTEWALAQCILTPFTNPAGDSSATKLARRPYGSLQFFAADQLALMKVRSGRYAEALEMLRFAQS